MKKRLIPIFMLVAYSAILIKVMVFKDIPTIRLDHLMLNFGGTYEIHPANFVPLKTIVPYLLGEKGLIIAGINLVGNIAPFAPIGFLVPLVYRNITWKKSVVLALAAGLAIEVMQTLLHVGIFDIDDVILNAFGVTIGYTAFVTLTKWVRSREYKNIIISVIIIMAAAAGAFYAIYPKDQQSLNSREGEISKSENLCGDTPGTGQIVGQGNHTITIKRNDEVIQTINLTDRTEIKNSAGPIYESDLKIGNRVTLVVNESEIASTVLVCNISDPETRSGR